MWEDDLNFSVVFPQSQVNVKIEIDVQVWSWCLPLLSFNFFSVVLSVWNLWYLCISRIHLCTFSYLLFISGNSHPSPFPLLLPTSLSLNLNLSRHSLSLSRLSLNRRLRPNLNPSLPRLSRLSRLSLRTRAQYLLRSTTPWWSLSPDSQMCCRSVRLCLKTTHSKAPLWLPSRRTDKSGRSTD